MLDSQLTQPSSACVAEAKKIRPFYYGFLVLSMGAFVSSLWYLRSLQPLFIFFGVFVGVCAISDEVAFRPPLMFGCVAATFVGSVYAPLWLTETILARLFLFAPVPAVYLMGCLWSTMKSWKLYQMMTIATTAIPLNQPSSFESRPQTSFRLFEGPGERLGGSTSWTPQQNLNQIEMQNPDFGRPTV